MELFKIENLSFSYPNRVGKALDNINLTVNSGDFVLLCGKSGCGKTTLLRLLKPSLSPFGRLSGEIIYNNKKLSEINTKEQTADIGFVLQNPDNQIVTDKVWHEMAFGLESLGKKTPEIRTKVSEMASFFGIQNWFYKKTNELSGGQKQLLNLASVMIMQPEVLILDEPTSQLDPIAASEFLNTLKKINNDLGTTIILSEHRLEETFALADRVLVMDNGKIIANDTPENVGKLLNETNHDMYDALPVPMRVFGQIDNGGRYPVTICDGRCELLKYAESHTIDGTLIPDDLSDNPPNDTPAIEVKNAFFRYEKDLPDVVKNLNLTVNKGEFFAVLGCNGTGKTTAISLISNLHKPQRGEVYINGKEISTIDNLYDGLLGVLPQNPQTLFAKKTVRLDLADMTDKKLSVAEKDAQVNKIASLCRIENLLDFHPYDLSGGEQQRVALAMILLRRPSILIADEPTKGMDAHFKRIFADILFDLKESGVTILMVSHDIEFCAEYADKSAMFFDGCITSTGSTREFFQGNSFYTTSANRMARNILPNAVLADDIVTACKGKLKQMPKREHIVYNLSEKPKVENNNPKLTAKRVISGILFFICFVITYLLQKTSLAEFDGNKYVMQALSVLFAAFTVASFAPQREIKTSRIQVPKSDRRLKRRTLTAATLILIAIPFTIFFGIYYLGDRKYYFISLLIILETILPFCMIFENRKPQAREIVIISVLCAISVVGRAAFFMLPEFKPVVALVIISGICFGGESGFLVGCVTGFVSNFIFGQGPWTPWQMFAFGIIGFIAGLLFKKGFLLKTKVSLSVFGFLSTLIIYGGIMNTASVLMITSVPNIAMLKSAYIMGFPIDLIHALSTTFFLWFISEPMIEKLERVKVKYGLIEK